MNQSSDGRRQHATIMITFPLLLALLLPGRSPLADDENLAVLKSATDGPPAAKLVYHTLRQAAGAAFDERRQKFERLTTPDECRQWQRQRVEFFTRQLGGFPERTPLEAQTVGTLEGDGYRIEKVIFASRPRHHVTATLYLPDAKPPYPAVLVACGHSRTAKASDYNQKMCILLARNGLAAFCYDPIGQGERSQIIDDAGKPLHNGTTTEHFLVGVGSILVGRNTAGYRVWDGMRAIDYLASRNDIDASRIGCTGCSGGGTETSYLMALDERIACAAPACYITTFERLLDTIGPQDAEQNIFGQIAFGMDQPDYLIMRAPRPTLICATTSDFFDIHGTWDAFRQASRIYGRLSAASHMALIEADGKHGIGQLGREAMVAWMRRWLSGIDAPVTDSDSPLRSEQELYCTPAGQVMLLADERSVFDLNEELARDLAAQRGEIQKKTLDERRLAVCQVTGIRTEVSPGKQKEDATDTLKRDGYRIEKMAFVDPTGITIPCLLFIPNGEKKAACLYLHDQGKHVDAGAGGPIERRVKQGQVVMAVDLPGSGETAANVKDPLLGANWKEFYLAYLLGRSMLAIRTEAILAGLPLVSGERDLPVHLVGIGELAVPALHAAALKPGRFTSLTLKKKPTSWMEVVGERKPANQLVNVVHGALRVYDLPDLRELCGDLKVNFKDD